MDFAMQTLCLPEDLYKDDPEAYNDAFGRNSWSADFTLTNDRRSLSEVSSMSRMPSSANSTTSEAPTPGTALSVNDEPATGAKPKRRRENRYKNAPPAVISRRRAQNRASQRAYRERKDQRIRDLEELLDEAHHKEETLSQAYHSLQVEYDRLVAERHDQHPVDDGSAFADQNLFSPSELAPGSMSSFEFMDGMSSNDMMAGLYLQQGHSTYPPIA